MQTSTLIRRGLGYYWRTHLAVVAGVSTAVTVLAGALLVGDSVRASLRQMVLARLGRTTHVIVAQNFFREQLADDLVRQPAFADRFTAACPLIILEGALRHEKSGRQALRVTLYGVDDRFWKFQAQVAPESASPSAAWLSPGLAEDLAPAAGDALLLRVQMPSAIPLESLHARRDRLGRTLRLTMQGVLPAARLGEFSLRPQQGSVRAIFVPLAHLQRDLRQERRANAVLASSRGEAGGENARELSRLLRSVASLEDFGVKLRVIEHQNALSLESDQGLVSDRLADAGERAADALILHTAPVFTYLANSMRIGSREIPYSLVTALDLDELGAHVAPRDAGEPPIVLNDWAARELNARPGDQVTLDYYVWKEEGALETRHATFRLASVIPLAGRAADPDFAPDYPGITESASLADWDPPFPIDLGRVRPRDEDYWKKWRTTPKAFIALEVGRQLWPSRFGKLTSLRIAAHDAASVAASLESFRNALRAALDPVAMGFSVYPVRTEGLAAARGAVNFGEYFLYFSFFLVVSGILLTGLFFKLGVEMRQRELGLLRAVGFTIVQAGKQFLGEGALLAAAGCLAGLVGAVGYGRLILFALRTWWVDAVGTRLLELHISPLSLAAGAAGGFLAAMASIAWVMHSIRGTPPRSLLTGAREMGSAGMARAARGWRWAGAALAASLALLLAASRDLIGQEMGFFGAGSLLLTAFLCFAWSWLTRRSRGLARRGWQSISQLGFRNTTWRPGRSLLCLALLASATFILVAVEAFRREDSASALGRRSGNGGFALLGESLLPIPYDLNSKAAKDALSVSDEAQNQLAGVRFVAMRLRPGDDASCLNLYRPKSPRVLGVPDALLNEGRFSFQSSLAETPEERKNPWLLLHSDGGDGSVPAIVDSNSLTYVLHLRLGEQFVLEAAVGRPVRFRIVGALADSIFQSELLISEKNFLRLFPSQQGYRFFLMEMPEGRARHLGALLKSALSDFGLDVAPTEERLAAFHRVENTYLSTFQALGGLGLLLGTVGLAAVLLRNVLERRRELALLRAVGYRKSALAGMITAETALLLVGGVLAGVLCALVAILPAFLSRGGHLPVFSLVMMLLLVLLTGLVASLLGVAAAVRAPLLESLRAE